VPDSLRDSLRGLSSCRQWNQGGVVPFSYFHEEFVRGTFLIGPRSISASGGLLATIGHPQSQLVDEITVRMSSPAETDRLNLIPGTPVAEITRTGYGEDGTPLRVMVTVVPGDRNLFVYEIGVR
jgi:DNA-binding GntR family transcriptional regulator